MDLLHWRQPGFGARFARFFRFAGSLHLAQSSHCSLPLATPAAQSSHCSLPLATPAAQSSHCSLPFATPAAQSSHCSLPFALLVSLASSARLIAPTGGSRALEPVSPASSAFASSATGGAWLPSRRRRLAPEPQAALSFGTLVVSRGIWRMQGGVGEISMSPLTPPCVPCRLASTQSYNL